jgi:hypothetical protein
MAEKEQATQPTHRAYSVIRREGQDDFWLNVGVCSRIRAMPASTSCCKPYRSAARSSAAKLRMRMRRRKAIADVLGLNAENGRCGVLTLLGPEMRDRQYERDPQFGRVLHDQTRTSCRRNDPCLIHLKDSG